MKIDVRVVPQGRSELKQDLLLEEFKGGLPPFSEKIRAFAELDRMGETIVVSVRFESVFEMQCSRCLEDCGVNVNGDLRVILKEEQGKYGPSFDDECGTDFFFDVNHEVVDISSAVYDEIMTALPLKPLCSQDCRGIELSKSGISLESKDSVCGGDKPIDPRWEALRKLKK
ncbi:MAG: DUF177 domain-containing protein [Chitinispirillales bacterium]|jgi:uncharacterized protein|nr:DUF177 domain-containing protein [Chitinispirillales bacterium]